MHNTIATVNIKAFELTNKTVTAIRLNTFPTNTDMYPSKIDMYLRKIFNRIN